MTFSERIENAVNFIRGEVLRPFDTLLVLGSGFRDLAENFLPYGKMSFQSIPQMQTASAPGHESNFYFANWKNRHLAIMAGRFHLYEGFDFEEITFPIFVFEKLGVKNLILTNASGGLTEKINVGEVVQIIDFLGLFSGAFGSSHRKIKDGALLDFQNLKNMKTGTYAFMPGPNFGTAAEYSVLKKSGADLVGMSTYPEAMAARELGLKTVALSVPVCSYHPPENMKEPTEEEVIAASEKALPEVFKIISEIDLIS